MEIYEWDEKDEFESWAKQLEEDSPYKRVPAPEAKWMSVPDMGKLLGLHKTDRYWLVKKQFFKTEIRYGQMWVEKESFEKWYANQVKYHKVTGEEPGLELKARSYSVQELAQMLELTDGVMYDLIKANNIEVILVDYWKRVPREAFWNWYNNQHRYRTIEDKKRDADFEAKTISMPEMARALGVSRQRVYQILSSQKYGGFFKPVYIAERKRFWRTDWELFLESQDEYKLKPEELSEEESVDQNIETQGQKEPEPCRCKYYSLKEAAKLAGVAQGTISKWCASGKFSFTKIDKRLKIPKEEFDQWVAERNIKKGR